MELLTNVRVLFIFFLLTTFTELTTDAQTSPIPITELTTGAQTSPIPSSTMTTTMTSTSMASTSTLVTELSTGSQTSPIPITELTTGSQTSPIPITELTTGSQTSPIPITELTTGAQTSPIPTWTPPSTTWPTTTPASTTTTWPTTTLASTTTTAPAVCNEAKLQSAVLYSNGSVFYSFGQAGANTLAASKETCKNSAIGYTATVKCQTRTNIDGTVTAYYEYATLREVSCAESPTTLLDHIKKQTATTENVESNMAVVSVLSTDFSSKTTKYVKDVVQAIHAMNNQIKQDYIQITERTMNYFVWTTDNLNTALQSSNDTVLTDQEKLQYIEALEVFSSNMILTQDKLTMMSPSSVFEAQKIPYMPGVSPGAIEFSGSITDVMPRSGSPTPPSVQSTIPASAIPASTISNMTNALFYLHKTGVLFPRPNDSALKIGQVVSVQISNMTLQNLKDPIQYSFTRAVVSVQTEKVSRCTIHLERCGYFSIPDSTWKFDGCVTNVDQSNTSTTCYCNHTTNFAVLTQTQYVQENLVLNVVGRIGCICSILGLPFLTIVYLSFKSLRTNKINQIHMHLSICLLVGYITFLVGVERPRAYSTCNAVGFILQFSFLSAWGWMFIEFFTMYKKLIVVITEIGSKYLLKCSVLVYSMSLLITGATLIVAYTTGDSVQYTNWSIAPTSLQLIPYALFHIT
ncbi:uncharacterized protein LOC120337552 isoform X2 [Styela clava]